MFVHRLSFRRTEGLEYVLLVAQYGKRKGLRADLATWAEVYAVIARMERERVLAKVLVAAAREALEGGPWRRLNAVPDWKLVQALSSKWPLRGADLWHLAVAKSLKPELPELTFMSYDTRLIAAARGEGLA